MTGYNRGQGNCFRWMGGIITPVVDNDPVHRSLHKTYSVATVFTQVPDTPHLLVVLFNAQLMHAHQNQRGWRPLAFCHVQIDSTSIYTYSHVSAIDDHEHIAAPGSSD